MTTQTFFSFAQPALGERTVKEDCQYKALSVRPEYSSHVLRGRKTPTFQFKTKLGVVINIVAGEVFRSLKDDHGRNRKVIQTVFRVLSKEITGDCRMEIVEDFWLGEDFNETCFKMMVEWVTNEGLKSIVRQSNTAEVVDCIQDQILEFSKVSEKIEHDIGPDIFFEFPW